MYEFLVLVDKYGGYSLGSMEYAMKFKPKLSIPCDSGTPERRGKTVFIVKFAQKFEQLFKEYDAKTLLTTFLF